MKKTINIAVDAMGGDNSPSKVIEGISIHHQNSRETNYKIFGNEKLINPLILKNKLPSNNIEIIHTEKIVENEDSALSAAKKGKDTSLWLAIDSLKTGSVDTVFEDDVKKHLDDVEASLNQFT